MVDTNNIKFVILTILSVKFSDINYIQIIEQPSPLPSSCFYEGMDPCHFQWYHFQLQVVRREVMWSDVY